MLQRFAIVSGLLLKVTPARVPRDLLVAWMGEDSGLRGIVLAWLAGLLLPGGPYVVFPLAATLCKQGVGAGALIMKSTSAREAFVAARTERFPKTSDKLDL